MDIPVGRVSMQNEFLPVYSSHPAFNPRHEFEWKREECILIRKPDPPVLVAIAKEPPGKLKTKAVQILDYNLNRCASVLPSPSSSGSSHIVGSTFTTGKV